MNADRGGFGGSTGGVGDADVGDAVDADEEGGGGCGSDCELEFDNVGGALRWF
jgi:hypothetical protein